MVRVFTSFESFYMFFSDELMSIQELLAGCTYTMVNGWFSFELTDEAKEEACKFVAKGIYSSYKERKEAAEAMFRGRGDSRYLKHFYLKTWNEKAYIDTFLSGEASDYCKRMFLKSARKSF